MRQGGGWLRQGCVRGGRAKQGLNETVDETRKRAAETGKGAWLKQGGAWLKQGERGS